MDKKLQWFYFNKGMGQPGGAAFSPDDLAGLVLWLKSDTGTFQDTGKTTPADGDGDLVAVWADQSGAGLDATQTGADATKPEFNTAQVNGQPSLSDRAATNNFLTTAALDLSGTNQFSVFVVANVPTFAASAGIVIEQSDNAGASDGFYIAVGKQAGGAGLRLNGTTTAGTITVGDGYWDTGAWVIISGIANSGGTSAAYKNGSLGGSATTNYGNFGNDILSMFARSNNTVNLNDGAIAEVIIYNTALSDADRGSVESYLSDRYNIALA